MQLYIYIYKGNIDYILWDIAQEGTSKWTKLSSKKKEIKSRPITHVKIDVWVHHVSLSRETLKSISSTISFASKCISDDETDDDYDDDGESVG